VVGVVEADRVGSSSGPEVAEAGGMTTAYGPAFSMLNKCRQVLFEVLTSENPREVALRHYTSTVPRLHRKLADAAKKQKQRESSS